MAQYSARMDIDIWEAENTFYLRSHPGRIAKLLAHYELYRKVSDLPGAIVELGVYKGASLARFATFRSICENDHSRPIYGFDAFGAFPRGEVSGDADARFIEKFEASGGDGIAKDELEGLLAAKGFGNIELVGGNIFDTLDPFLERSPHLRIALMHLDMDVYEPTAFAIDRLLPRMVRGGLVVFDDYGAVEGATRAAEEMCARHDLRLHKLGNYSVPSYAVIP